MKKALLAAAAMLAIGSSAMAQPFSENFNSGIPSNWPMIKADNNTISPNLVQSIVTKLGAQAWMAWPKATGDSCVITTSWFSPAGKADRWLLTPAFQVTDPNMVLSWEDYATDNSYPDSMQVWVSPTAGTTASSFTTVIYNDKGGADNFIKKGVSLGAYNGQTIRIAFRNNSTDKAVLMMDNVNTQVITALDGAVDSLAFPKIAGSGSPVKVKISNQGATNLTSVTLTYDVDGGSPVSQTFPGLNIMPYGSAWVTFSSTVTAGTGSHTLTVNLTQVNGTADPVASNNSKSSAFASAGASVQRNALIEEFTSSTCGPCAIFNVTFDPLINANNVNNPSSNFNIIKYQMNWPNPGNDVSYNNDGYQRRVYYQVNSIPDHYTNGKPGGAGNQAEIDNAKLAPAYLTMSGTYTIESDSLIATVTLTPNFTLNNANFKLYMAATEAHYTNNGATTSQKQYYHVMRKMLPDGNGITVNSFTSGTPQTFTQKFKYTVGTVTQMSNTFWGSPFAGNLVAFVQDPSSDDIIQSVSIPAQWPTAVNDLNGGLGNPKVYPNPAKEIANIAFTLDKGADISLNVMDATGRVVYSVKEKMNAGAQHMFIPTSKLTAGVYSVIVSSEEGSLKQNLTVIK